MSSVRHPVGPQPPSVYWRRRLLLALGVVAVIVIVLLIVFAPKGGATPAAEKSNTPASGSTPKPSSTKTPACDTADLTVQAKVDAASYGAESQPQLSFTITNDSSVACTVNAGSDVQVFAITSGNETYWTSTDCQTDEQKYTTTVQPGDQIASSAIAWDRTRSSKTTCDSDRPQVPTNGATYHLAVTVDGVKSDNTPGFVLD